MASELIIKGEDNSQLATGDGVALSETKTAEPQGVPATTTTQPVSAVNANEGVKVEQGGVDGATATDSIPGPGASLLSKSDASVNTKDDEEVPVTFPQRLMEILSNEAYNEIMTWLPHGKGFIIRDKKRFADEVLPKFFKKSKFTSFTRKLNRWNYVRVTRGHETGAYYHPLFRKDNPKLCTQMTCINAKSSQQLQPMDPVALGLGTGGSLYPDMSDPAVVARMNEQRNLFFQQQWQQQQAFMAMMAQQQQANPEQKDATTEEGKEDEAGAAGAEGKTPEEQAANTAAMMAFQQQQQQYYAMFMAQQHHMALGTVPPNAQVPFVGPPFPLPPSTGNSAQSSLSGTNMDLGAVTIQTGNAMETGEMEGAPVDAAHIAGTDPAGMIDIPGTIGDSNNDLAHAGDHKMDDLLKSGEEKDDLHEVSI